MNRVKETIIDANSVRVKLSNGRVIDILALHDGNLRLDYSFSPDDWRKGQPSISAKRVAANQVEVYVNEADEI